METKDFKIQPRDMATMRAALIRYIAGLSVIILLVFILGGYMADYLFLLVLAVGVAYIIATYTTWQDIARERALLIAFKQQTRSIFIGSRGVSETHEDDSHIMARKEFAIEYLKRAKNPHGVKIYTSFFRDVAVIAYHLDSNCRVKKTETIIREGIKVTETRDQYAQDWAYFQAQQLQADLVAARTNPNSLDWVAENLFSQDADAVQELFK